MKTILLFLTFFCFLGCFAVNAQVKPRSKAPVKTVTTQTATTEDGKRVILRSNGTWAYDTSANTTGTLTAQPKETSKAGTKTVSVKTGRIDLEAGLIFNSGDVKPVGRATFYLLKEDASKIILTQPHLDAHNQDIGRFGRTETLDKWSMYGAVLYIDGSLSPTFALAVKTALDAASVGQTTTGFDGKATFQDVPVGDYFLFGYYTIGKQTTYWNLPVTVKAGANKVVLDNNNMKG
jgi:hypothetical protein